MSVTDLPVCLFLQRSTSFCNSVKNDLDEFVRNLDSDFGAVNREIKVTPKYRRSTIVDLPGSCTLDVKEFTRSKENVLRSLKINFAEMEMKWNSEVAELKDWFLMHTESCLSKMQLQVTVTAEELNLREPDSDVEVCEDESSSSGSEITVAPATRQTPQPPHSLIRPAVAAKKKVSFSDSPAPKRACGIQTGKKATGVTSAKPGSYRTVDVSRPIVSISEQAMKIAKTDWMSLSRATEVAPSESGVYEVKQSRAKNSAYIGYGEDLKKCFLQYWEGKSSRVKQKKQLENFIQRNKEEISVRYEVHFSPESAHHAQQKKLKEFLEQHKKPPSHNYGM